LFIKGYYPRNLVRKEEKRKPDTTWLGNIIQWTDVDLERVLSVMDNRSPWRSTIHGEVNCRTEDDWSQVKSAVSLPITWPSIVCTDKPLDLRCSLQTYHCLSQQHQTFTP